MFLDFWGRWWAEDGFMESGANVCNHKQEAYKEIGYFDTIWTEKGLEIAQAVPLIVFLMRRPQDSGIQRVGESENEGIHCNCSK